MYMYALLVQLICGTIFKVSSLLALLAFQRNMYVAMASSARLHRQKQMYTTVSVLGSCMRLSFWNGYACDGLKVILLRAWKKMILLCCSKIGYKWSKIFHVHYYNRLEKLVCHNMWEKSDLHHAFP